MESKRPLILVTNDDGYTAKGIQELVKMVAPLGDIVMVAPDGARSGNSSAITSNLPIRLKLEAQYEGFRGYSCSGTPVDCVKLALDTILDCRPDLILSGINNGSNAAVCVIYSGTMGAALEGAIVGIPAIGFSYCGNLHPVDLTPFTSTVQHLSRTILSEGLPSGVCLNVNIPHTTAIQGVRICTQTKGRWTEEYVKRTDPTGNDYYWLTGHFENSEPDNEQSDEWALAHGYITVVPTTCDMTHYDGLQQLSDELEIPLA